MSMRYEEDSLVTLFLGAGFSKWAFDLPLVNNLFDFSSGGFDYEKS